MNNRMNIVKTCSFVSLLAVALLLCSCGESPDCWKATRIDNSIEINSIHGSNDTAFAVGGSNYGGIILSLDGEEWKRHSQTTSYVLESVWVNNPLSVMAVGGPSVVKYDGTEWNEVILPSENSGITLRSAWSDGRESAFVAGSEKITQDYSNGYIGFFDGSGWSSTIIDETGWIDDVWGISNESLYAVNDGIHYFNGLEWSFVVTGFQGSYRSVWGISDERVYAVGSKIIMYNSERWSLFLDDDRVNAQKMMGTSEDNLFVIGPDEKVFHFDGMKWKDVSVSRGYTLKDIWVGPNGHVYVVGSSLESREPYEPYGVILTYTCK